MFAVVTTPSPGPTFNTSSHDDPSPLTLIEKLSFPAMPISARPDQFVWNKSDAVSDTPALLILSWWPDPSWVRSVAGD